MELISGTLYFVSEKKRRARIDGMQARRCVNLRAGWAHWLKVVNLPEKVSGGLAFIVDGGYNEDKPSTKSGKFTRKSKWRG